MKDNADILEDFFAARRNKEETAESLSDVQNMKKKRKIEFEMKLIESQNRFNCQPLQKRIRQENQGMSEAQVRKKVEEIEKKNCQRSFKSPPRQYLQALDVRHDGPALLGKYEPQWHLVEPNNFKMPNYRPTPTNEGFMKKRSLNLTQMKICPHAIRVLEKSAQNRNHKMTLKKPADKARGTAHTSRKSMSPRNQILDKAERSRSIRAKNHSTLERHENSENM